MGSGKEVKEQTDSWSSHISLVVWGFIGLFGIAMFIDFLSFISRLR
jgi:hypothetical protein